jgi:hypothetical protein
LVNVVNYKTCWEEIANHMNNLKGLVSQEFYII